MADTLPHTDAALVAQCQRDYESAASMGGQQALDACFRCLLSVRPPFVVLAMWCLPSLSLIPCWPPLHRLSWALVHSPAPANIKRGLDLAEALLDGLPEGGGGGGVGGSEGDAEGPPPLDSRDLRYLLAVGKYRQRRYIEVQHVLRGLWLDAAAPPHA